MVPPLLLLLLLLLLLPLVLEPLYRHHGIEQEHPKKREDLHHGSGHSRCREECARWRWGCEQDGGMKNMKVIGKNI
jgi:hypothetical protein